MFKNTIWIYVDGRLVYLDIIYNDISYRIINVMLQIIQLQEKNSLMNCILIILSSLQNIIGPP